MTIHNEALDLLARLVEDRPNTLAGVADDEHGNYCVYCGRRGWQNRPRPDHRRDCPIQRGQELLARVYAETRTTANPPPPRAEYPGALMDIPNHPHPTIRAAHPPGRGRPGISSSPNADHHPGGRNHRRPPDHPLSRLCIRYS